MQHVFLCLLTLGLPYDLVKEMTKFTKRLKINLLRIRNQGLVLLYLQGLLYKKHKVGQWHFSVLAKTPNKNVISEFKLAWRWNVQIRRDLIIRMINFQNIQDIDRLKHDFDPFNGRYRIDSDKDRPKKGRYHSSEGLWDVWSTWGDYPIKNV